MDKSSHTEPYRRVLAALRQARENAGLTQQLVTERLDTYASFVSKVESGERRLDVVELASLCRVYGIALDDFLRTTGLLA
jgi:transcriptional regulator with XRE-family HTH domain